jgi:hypothetical protein
VGRRVIAVVVPPPIYSQTSFICNPPVRLLAWPTSSQGRSNYNLLFFGGADA